MTFFTWLRAKLSAILTWISQLRPQKKKAARKKRFVRWAVVLFFLTIGIFSYATNPFVRFTLIQDPFDTITVDSNQFVVEPTSELILKQDPYFTHLALLKSGWHIFSSKFTGGPKAKKSSVDSIIAQVHDLRFNPQRPFLISGDHFSVLYPRSLGIFYHSILDPRTALSETDWNNRQLIYLKTAAYALDVYRQSDRLSTTIVPVGPRSVALINIYSLPSDTLFSILYSLQVMLSEDEIINQYPYQTSLAFDTELKTTDAAKILLQDNSESLRRHYQTFLRDVIDPATGLVSKDILLSGTKDITKRKSAFYDNVMVWKTNQLMQKLGLIDTNQAELDSLKQKILTAFWLEKEGYFLEDLSDDSLENKYYSSDWLIAYQVGMLDPRSSTDLAYLTRSVAYIRRNAIDQPFGLQYHPDIRPSRLHTTVKIFAPSYGSSAIWSNWGQEYIKLLAHLAQVTNEQEYLNIAEDQVEAYTYNIKRYQGYPELYNDQGDFYRQFFYKSVRQTGWVVSYEQARDMVEWTSISVPLAKPSNQISN